MKRFILAKAIVTAAATKQQIDEIEHLVIPVTAMVWGVLNGVYYSKEAIELFANTWNGVPISAGHPQKDGIYVSANAPEFYDTVNIGQFFNVECTDGKLTGEIWINIEKANRLGFGSIVEDAESGKMAEVSTGLYSDVLLQAGVHNNVSYNLAAQSIHSDHLAILGEGEIGACSIEDGCGTFQTNEQGEHIMTVQNHCGSAECTNCNAHVVEAAEQSKISAAFKSLGEMLGLNADKEVAVIANQDEEIVANEMSHEEIRRAIDTKLDDVYQNQDGWPWLRDVFDDDFIFEWKAILYRQSYYEKDGVITFGEDAVEVIRTVEYKLKTEVEANADTIIPNQDEDSKMNEKELVVAALIANAGTTFTDENQAELMAINLETLKQMTPVVNETEAVASSLTEADAESLALFRANETKRVDTLRKVVSSAYKIPEEVAANMSTEDIETMAGKITPAQKDYSGAAGTGATADTDRVFVQKGFLLVDPNKTAEVAK